MKIPIVNEQDEIIAYKEREEATREDIRRIIALHVFNENLEILIAKRQSTKIIDPDKWGPSVAGTVDKGNDYDVTVVKEAEEELGLKDIKPIFYTKMFYETHNARRFTGVYYVVVNSEERDLILQEEEVSEIKWISISDLEDWWIKKPEDFVPSFGSSMNIIKEIYQKINL
jgi:isopentenyldiphosphate isomerase